MLGAESTTMNTGKCPRPPGTDRPAGGWAGGREACKQIGSQPYKEDQLCAMVEQQVGEGLVNGPRGLRSHPGKRLVSLCTVCVDGVCASV